MTKTDTPKFDRYYLTPNDKLIFETLRIQLAKILGRPLLQADFAALIAKHGEPIRDLITELETVE